MEEVAPDEAPYETLDGDGRSLRFDFVMLLPPFSGIGLKAFDRTSAAITPTVFAPNGFMLGDGDSAKKPYEGWSPDDWPRTDQLPKSPNVFAVGIAFAPPHALSKPMTSPKGTPIFPTPPRTGMPTGVMAREVAFNIVDMIEGNATAPTRQASLAHMGAACIASAGAGLFRGTAVSMRLFPIIPDFKKDPDTGRDLDWTFGEIGLAGHRIKHLLHLGFIYEASATLPLGDGAGMSATKPPAGARTPFEQTYDPPVPTGFTKKMRTDLLWQLARFAVINVKILRMVRRHSPAPPTAVPGVQSCIVLDSRDRYEARAR